MRTATNSHDWSNKGPVPRPLFGIVGKWICDKWICEKFHVEVSYFDYIMSDNDLKADLRVAMALRAFRNELDLNLGAKKTRLH